MNINKYRMYDTNNKPEWLDSDWWNDTDNCNHLDSDNGVHVQRLKAASETCMRAANETSSHSIVDLGAGDGGLLSLLTPPHKRVSWGYETITDSVRYANEIRGVSVQQANVLRDWNNLRLSPTVVATEMLEHIENPYEFVQRVFNKCTVMNFIASSPHSETREQHEWNHAWVWDREGYREMFEVCGWVVREHFDVEWSQILWGTKIK